MSSLALRQGTTPAVCLLCCSMVWTPAQAGGLTPEQRQQLRHEMREQWQQNRPPGSSAMPGGSDRHGPAPGMQPAALQDGPGRSGGYHAPHRERCERGGESCMKEGPPPGFPRGRMPGGY